MSTAAPDPPVPGCVVVELVLVVGSDPIAGTLSSASTARVGFAGWIELTSALEQVHRGDGPSVA